MGVSAGITIAFAGAPAQIPAGWTRVASLDARHTRGAAAGIDAGGIGGGAAHTHASSAHTHASGGLHTHTVTTPSSSDVVEPSARGINASGPGTPASTTSHLHIHTVSGVPFATDSAGATAASWQQVAIEPPFYTVIWIQSDGTPPGIPAGSIVWWNNTITPAGFTQHSASGGRFLKGAIAGRGGASNGGALTPHQHLPADHTHPMAGHNHGSGTADITTYTGFGVFNIPSGVLISTANHAQPYTVSAGTDEPRTSTGMITFPPNGTTTLDPPYIVLQAVVPIVNTAAAGIIAIWNGSIASIPAGWELCDGTGSTPDCRARLVRSATTGYVVGATGGAATHTHALPGAHAHNDNPHFHFVLFGPASGSNGSDRDQAIDDSPDGHTHFAAFADPATATLVTTVEDTQPASNLPLYTDVLYVQLVTTLGPAFVTPSSGEVFTDDTPTFQWSFFTMGGHPQAAYHILIYAADGATLVYDSGEQTSSSLTAAIPVGYLHNGRSYFAQVGVTDTVGLFGLSSLVPFSIHMIAPATPAITATAEPLARPPDVLIQWTPPAIIVGDTFNYYTIERRLSGTLPWVPIAQISNHATTSYRDYTGIPGTAYEYAMTYTVTRTGDQVVSAEQAPPPAATLAFIGVWIHVVTDPSIWLEYLANGEKVQPIQDQKIIPVWGRAKPTAHIGELLYDTIQYTGIPEFYPTTTWQAGLEQFFKATENGEVLCVRMGQMQELRFCIIDPQNTSRTDYINVYETNIAVTEINYEEGVLIL